MADLSVNTPRVYGLTGCNHNISVPVAGTTNLREGAAVGLTSGYLDNADATAGFIGFLSEQANNASGSAGDITGQVIQKGFVDLSITGVSAVTDIGSAVYAVDSATFTKSSTGNIQIGKIVKWLGGTKATVYFEGTLVRSI